MHMNTLSLRSLLASLLFCTTSLCYSDHLNLQQKKLNASSLLPKQHAVTQPERTGQHISAYCIWYMTKSDNFSGRGYLNQSSHNTAHDSRTSMPPCNELPAGITTRNYGGWDIVEFKRVNNEPQGFFSVKLIGSLRQGRNLYLVNDSGGGSGQFSSLVIINQDHSGLHYQCKIAGGDRMSGGFSHVKLIPNGLFIQRYATNNPAITQRPALNTFTINLTSRKHKTICAQIKASMAEKKQ